MPPRIIDEQGGKVRPFPVRPEAAARMAVASGGGGPHDPDMDARVTRLEDQFSRIEALLKGLDDRVRHVERDTAETKGRLANLPTTWAMIATVIGGQVALGGLILAALRIAGAH